MTFKPNPFAAPAYDAVGNAVQTEKWAIGQPAGFVDSAYNDGGTVVIDDTGITVTDGAITVTNASSTVIIDGTSDMFRILASGTTSKATADNTSTSTSTVTLAALGTWSAAPALLSFINDVNLPAGPVYSGAYIFEPASAAFVAGTSGGSPTSRAIIQNVLGQLNMQLDGSNQAQLRWRVSIQNLGAARTLYARYYVLVQTAI